MEKLRILAIHIIGNWGEEIAYLIVAAAILTLLYNAQGWSLR